MLTVERLTLDLCYLLPRNISGERTLLSLYEYLPRRRHGKGWNRTDQSLQYAVLDVSPAHFEPANRRYAVAIGRKGGRGLRRQ